MEGSFMENLELVFTEQNMGKMGQQKGICAFSTA